MTDDVTAVRIRHGGKRLFGIVHVPRSGARDLGVVFLSSGLQNRAGPHRIYVRAARRFSELGVTSLRLDLPGVGDSDEHDVDQTYDCHDPDSVPDAVDFFMAEHGVKRIVLLGLCAGGRVAIKAAARDPRVSGVAAWSVPIISGPVNMPVAKGGGSYMGATKAKAQFREWAPKLVNPAAWYKYLRSGKTLGEAWRMAARAFAGLLPERFRQKAPRQAEFFRSMDACVASQRRLLFVYGDEDKIACAEFSERYPQIAGARVPSCEYVVVPNGDHTFTRSVASDAAIERTRDWLARHYPG